MKTKIEPGQTVLIAAFGCLGKTTFANKYPHVALDIESIHYNYLYKKVHANDEVAKADDEGRRVNENYPENYIAEVKRNYGRYKFIFITLGKEIMQGLEEANMKYIILYPRFSRKEKILKDARNRGNTEKFVGILDTILSNTNEINTIRRDLNYDKLEFLENDQYVEDYINERYEYDRS